MSDKNEICGNGFELKAPMIELKAYHAPKLTQLGPIHSLVQHGVGTGSDGGTAGDNFGS